MKKKQELTKEALERILFYLEMARPADSELYDDLNEETHKEIDLLQEVIKMILKYKKD